ncbi:MAG: hypothetical protein ACRDH7_10685 [Actinomycetota bacterium]
MKNHGIADRLSGMAGRGRERLERSRMEKLDRDNDRLRSEVGLLRDGLDAERSSLKAALKGLEAHKVTVKESRRPHLIRALLIAAGAYVLGTRDGRERYRQIVQKAKSLSEGVTATSNTEPIASPASSSS